MSTIVHRRSSGLITIPSVDLNTEAELPCYEALKETIMDKWIMYCREFYRVDEATEITNVARHVRKQYPNFNVNDIPSLWDDGGGPIMHASFPYVFVACMRGNTLVLRVLVEFDPDLNSRIQSHVGWVTPFELTCRYAKTKTAAWLLTRPEVAAELNPQTISYTRNTPLGFAIESGNKSIIKLLLAHGADVRQRSRGRMPFTIARQLNAKGCKVEEGKGSEKEACMHILLTAERSRQVLDIGEWRPHAHTQFPLRFRLALRTLAILGKARKKAPEEEREQQHMCYQDAQLCLLPEELLQMLFVWVVSISPVSEVWIS